MFVKVPSDNLPYGLFALAGLIPWNFFSAALNRASNSLVGSANLITKIYFPRMLIPLASVLSGMVDIAITLAALVLIAVGTGYGLSWKALALPGFVLLAVITTFGFGLFLSALNVRFRDTAFVVPFLTQALFFVTPVIYSTTTFPEGLRWVFALNPMAAVVNGFRWALFGQPAIDWGWTALSFAFSLLALTAAILFFRRVERTFADVI
jgi:lipopolysaccharide transport system permease protein